MLLPFKPFVDTLVEYLDDVQYTESINERFVHHVIIDRMLAYLDRADMDYDTINFSAVRGEFPGDLTNDYIVHTIAPSSVKDTYVRGSIKDWLDEVDTLLFECLRGILSEQEYVMIQRIGRYGMRLL